MSDDLEQFAAELLLFLQESADYRRELAAGVLRQAAAHAARIHRRIQRAQDRYVIALVGLTNVGKSTLLNALLGEDLAPRRNGPCTAAPVEFVRGNSYHVAAEYDDDFRISRQRAQSADEVQKLLGEYVDSSRAVATRPCSRVIVELNHPLLANGLVLSDTPGIGAAQVDEKSPSHDEAVRRYLQEGVAHAVWVVLAEQGIGQRERLFFDQWLADLFVDVAVTGGDDWDTNCQARFQQRYRSIFTEEIPPFHFVGHARDLATDSLTNVIRALQTLKAGWRRVRPPSWSWHAISAVGCGAPSVGG